MRLVLDTTPLIHLTKAGFHLYFDRLEIDLVTTNEVLNEISIGDFREVEIIKNLIKSGKIKLENARSMEPVVNGVHSGEASVISLAREIKSPVVMDDVLGRNYAGSLGVEAFHSTFLIIRAILNGVLKKQDAVTFINKMIENGWRCDVETYKEILTKIESLQ